MTFYQRLIKELLPQVQDPRHVEAYLRLRYGTLDHLSREEFTEEGLISLEVIKADPKGAEKLAQSYGL